MIRRDYILRMLQEFLEVLSRIRALKQGQLWREAAAALDPEFQRLLGSGADAVLGLSDTELLARLIRSDPPQATREKTFMLIALLKEAGEVATADGKDGSRYYVKAVHLLLELLAQGDILDCPEFVPRVDELVRTLEGVPLPVETQARLMQHFERSGEFAKAEDRLYGIAETAPGHPGLLEFGMAFYERLRRQGDDALLAGNLPRAELETGAAEWQARLGQPAARS